MSGRTSLPWRARLTRAAALLLCGASILAAASWAQSFQGDALAAFAEGFSAAAAQADAVDEGAVPDAQSMFGQAVGSSSADADALPQDFAEEVVSGEGFDDVRVAEGGKVVGLLASREAQAMFSELDEHLVQAGWVRVGQGQELATTYLKQDGRYRWLAMSVVGVGACSSVVFVVE